MYLPKVFSEPDRERLLRLMRAHPFATVITPGNVGHLPLLVVEPSADAPLMLQGHLAKANPQCQELRDGAQALVIFHGPSTYITPSWYVGTLHVPTWNYAVVHARGPVRAIEDPAELQTLLAATVETFERDEPTPWRYDLPEEYASDLARAIVGFEIRVEQLEGKFKLSQNRTPEDRAGVLRGLATRKDEASRQILELMRER